MVKENSKRRKNRRRMVMDNRTRKGGLKFNPKSKPNDGRTTDDGAKRRFAVYWRTIPHFTPNNGKVTYGIGMVHGWYHSVLLSVRGKKQQKNYPSKENVRVNYCYKIRCARIWSLFLIPKYFKKKLTSFLVNI